MHMNIAMLARNARRSNLVRGLLLVCGIMVSSFVAQPAHAVNLRDSWQGANWSSQPAYVYVETGETLHLGLGTRSTEYTATRPDGTVAQLSLGVGSPGASCATGTTGQLCTMTEVATQTGVWILRATRTADPSNATVQYSQIVEVTNVSGVEQPGRMWFEALNLNQHQNNFSSISMYLMSQYGTTYRTRLLNFSGWGSNFSIDNKGAVPVGSCEPSYLSVPRYDESANGGLNGADYRLRPTDCPDHVRYRIYPELPGNTMPAATATWADGRTQDTWVYPAYQGASLTEPILARTDTTSYAGVITGTLSGQPGRVGVFIDVNDNGSFADPEDVVIPREAYTAGGVSFTWDGRDGLGNTIGIDKKITIQLNYTGLDEMHYMLDDGERSPGGLEVELIRGTDAPNMSLSWNDTRLPVRTGDVPPPVLLGDRSNSSGGIHGYTRTTNSYVGWGNDRYIDSWASYRLDAVSYVTITPTNTDDDSGTGNSGSGENPVNTPRSPDTGTPVTLAPWVRFLPVAALTGIIVLSFRRHGIR